MDFVYCQTSKFLLKFFSIILLPLLAACSSKQSVILLQADSMMESRPDSAMTLLEGIDRSKLNKSELPYFALLYTQAQVKTDIQLDSDTLISIAYAKYGNNFKGDRGLRSNFYTGEVFFNQQKNPEAMRFFLTVYEESKRNGNEYWHAKAAERISDLFFYAYNYDEAERYAQEAAGIFKLEERHTFQRYTLGKLAIIYLNNGKESQAFTLLDSLRQISLNEHPVDSLFMHYLDAPLKLVEFKSGNQERNELKESDSTKKKQIDPQSLDDVILQCEVSGDIDHSSVFDNIDTVRLNNDEKLHLLYALYKNAESSGLQSLALSYVDSLLLLQSIVTEGVIKESVTGAQRDFYSAKSIQQEERSTFFRYLLLSICISFIVVLMLIGLIVYEKYKAFKIKSDSDLEAIMSLKSCSETLILEKKELQESLLDKREQITVLNKYIEASRNKINNLALEIESKDSDNGRLEELITEKNKEYNQLQCLLNQKDSEFAKIQISLQEKVENEEIQTRIIESLFREKWTTLDKLCAEYFSVNQSEISNKVLLDNIRKEVEHVTSDKGIKEIVTAVDFYMGGIITLLRKQCPFIKETDINYIALVYAGFTVKAVCLFLNIKYQHFFVKKSRLIKRIKNSNAPDKDLFISKF